MFSFIVLIVYEVKRVFQEMWEAFTQPELIEQPAPAMQPVQDTRHRPR
ncbi:hypothetical protein LJC49_05170 [Ruminococcaceae bacterium OttesenSCG-928-I18]|nr:hypothetical protein [Ruminococcaceae bacterium OttesenSCG-928-I18]